MFCINSDGKLNSFKQISNDRHDLDAIFFIHLVFVQTFIYLIANRQPIEGQ